MGLKVVKNSRELTEAVKEAFEITEKVLVEEFVKGRDMTVGVLKDRALPVIEIRPKKGIYDYESKYTKGMTEYIFVEDDNLAVMLQDIALRVHRLLGLRDLSRVDFRVTDEGKPYILEVNTIPGMTELSLFPMACKKAGLDFREMLSVIVS
ncbi:MAG: ATP-grasp domain-containing protein [Aquificota bacterium]|nr:ATP-grasp domain-containing protein [Aquificota bacterium]